MLKQWVVDVKQWASSGNAAASPVDARGLQISVEALFVSICQKKHYLYRQNDHNKRRQKISQKIAQEKKRLLEEIQRYNQQPDGDPVDTNSVVQKLSNKAAESMIWPWQEQNTDGVDIITKKFFDQLMLVSRLTEEKQILLVKEMMQHCQYLKDSVAKVQSLMATVSECTQTGQAFLNQLLGWWKRKWRKKWTGNMTSALKMRMRIIMTQKWRLESLDLGLK